jgi:hypothetical protein
MKRLSCLLVSIVMLSTVFTGSVMLSTTASADIMSGDFTYTIGGDSLVANITGYSGEGGDIIIPSTLDGFPVAAIGDKAFYQCNSLTSVKIPIGVTSIGQSAFEECNSLKSIDLPYTVTTIRGYAFAYCTSLIDITIPDGITSLGDGIFRNCTSLTHIIIPDGSRPIGNHLFYGCSSLTFVKYPFGAGMIPKYQFAYCVSLKSFKIPETVGYIEQYAFLGCTSLESVSMNWVYHWEEGVFMDCSSLKTAVFNGQFERLPSKIFYGCTSLTNVTLPIDLRTLGSYSFAKCTSLINITMPRYLGAIEDYTFFGCTNLTNVIFPGLSAPTNVFENWVTSTNMEIRGHARADSNFPGPVSSFRGLTMGSYLPSVSDPPYLYELIPGNGQMTIKWYGPCDPYNACPFYGDGGYPIESYKIYRSDDQGTSFGIYHLVGTTTECNFTDFSSVNGMEYNYKVSAVNSEGESQFYGSIGSKAGLPEPVDNICGYEGDLNVTIVWGPPIHNGGFPLLSYSLYRSENYGPYTKIATVDAKNLSYCVFWDDFVPFYVDTDVIPLHQYSYYVIPTNEFGDSYNYIIVGPITVMAYAKISIYTESNLSETGLIIDLHGRISSVTGDVGIPGVPIDFYAYNVSNPYVPGFSLPSAISDANGEFVISWIPQEKGIYGIYAISRPQEGNYSAVQAWFCVVVISTESKDVLMVESNATVTDMFFNSEKKELRFTASGTPGMWFAFTKLTVSKGLVPDANDIRISFDGEDMTYELSETSTSWILYFTYHLSTHDIVAYLGKTNTAPTITGLTVPAIPIKIKAQAKVNSTFDDPDAADSHTAVWDWGDGTSSSGVVDEKTKVVTGSHSYSKPGLYVVSLMVIDSYSESTTAVSQTYMVVYDPAGGCVTGGGWIKSLAVAYKADPSLSGKAKFCFDVKYQKGAKVPTGHTEFQLGKLNFHSTSYNWMIINHGNAQLCGDGKINGKVAPNGQNYKFMIWAGDHSPDTFRMKIWWEDGSGEHVVYDNGVQQAIGGGSIVVHTK